MDRTKLPPESIRKAIEARLAGSAPGEPATWRPAAGGLSNTTVWRVAWHDAAFAVRRWGVRADPARLAWVHHTLATARSAGCRFLPEPFGGLSGNDERPFRSECEGLWEAEAWMPGKPLGPTSSPARLQAAVRGLAQLHARMGELRAMGAGSARQTPTRLARLMLLPSVADRPDQGSTAQWPELDCIVASLSAARDAAERALAAVDESKLRQHAIHGDARPEHFLLSGSELTGLVDFGAMRIDTPLADVARLAGEVALGDSDRFASVAEAYAAASNRPIDLQAIRALDAAGAVISAHNWLRWLSDPKFAARDPGLVRERLRSIAARLPVG